MAFSIKSSVQQNVYEGSIDKRRLSIEPTAWFHITSSSYCGNDMSAALALIREKRARTINAMDLNLWLACCGGIKGFQNI